MWFQLANVRLTTNPVPQLTSARLTGLVGAQIVGRPKRQRLSRERTCDADELRDD